LLEGGRESPHSNNLLGLAMGEGPWRAASMLGITLNFVRFMMMWVKWFLCCVHTERGFSMSRVRVGFFYPVIFLVANFCHCQK
jgi:hypothetical protein